MPCKPWSPRWLVKGPLPAPAPCSLATSPARGWVLWSLVTGSSRCHAGFSAHLVPSYLDRRWLQPAAGIGCARGCQEEEEALGLRHSDIFSRQMHLLLLLLSLAPSKNRNDVRAADRKGLGKCCGRSRLMLGESSLSLLLLGRGGEALRLAWHTAAEPLSRGTASWNPGCCRAVGFLV